MNLKDLRNLDKDDVLGLVGLESKHSTGAYLAGTLGTFGVGLLVGAGIALLLAPKPGSELREDIRGKLRRSSDESRSPRRSARTRRWASARRTDLPQSPWLIEGGLCPPETWTPSGIRVRLSSRGVGRREGPPPSRAPENGRAPRGV